MNVLTFNELSLLFKDKFEAIPGVKTFIKTWGEAEKLGFEMLRIHESIGKDLYHLQLAPGYFVYDWLNSPGDQTGTAGEWNDSNPDPRDRFKDIVTYSPLIHDDEFREKNEYDRSEFKIQLPEGEEKPAEGLGAAFLLDTIAISFLSHAFWDRYEIDNLRHFRISEEGNIMSFSVVVLNASRPEHIENHASWFENKRKSSLRNSRDLWERRKEFFPSLELCGIVEQQLKNIGIESSYFNQLYERLKALNLYAKNWTDGAFSESDIKKQYGLNVSTESRGTMDKYENERRFRLPDGHREIFKMHIKTGELRFHFFPDEKEHKIYVGYIGPHLRTISN